MKIPKETREWLLEAPEPYILYQAQRLLTPDSADPMLLDRDPFIQRNLELISSWRTDVLERHDKPGLFIHRLAMLADHGVTVETKGVRKIIDGLMKNIGKDGSFLINISIPKAFGGSGEAHRDWIICDFPVVLYALLRMTGADQRLDPAVEKLKGLVGPEFYPCCGSIPKFKGPGPRGGMCPYANLLAARALSAHPRASSSAAAKRAAGAVLDLWTKRKEKKPFLFAMGTDFLKLKLPMVWYNLLHVLSALKGIKGAAADPRYKELAAHLHAKLDDAGRATPESIYLEYKTEEWSDKKKPSRLMTVMVHVALKSSALTSTASSSA
jgi:hypothetical protein